MRLLRIAMFGGRVPRLAPRLLPDASAQQAMNTRLTSGELRPWWKPRVLASIALDRPKSVYRYMHNGVAKFLAFRRATSVVESALINDAFGRIYYSNADGFFVTTKADIDAGLPASAVGVPAPLLPAMAITPSGGTVTLTESRVYVATLVSKYGEESSPSAPILVSGAADGAWRVSGLDSLRYDATLYPNIKQLRVYRTITSNSGVDYRMAMEFAIDAVPAAANDTVDATVLASRPTMDSNAWSPPPLGLRGVISLPGGGLAGFKDRTVYLSEPYYPHAWPEEYQMAVDSDIVALGQFASALVIATVGRLGIAIGTTPDAMSLVKDGAMLPCLSADSLVSTRGAVLYASDEGLVSVSEAGADIATKAFLTRDEWARLSPRNIKGAVYEDRYLGFYSSSMGFAFAFSDPMTAWTDVQHPGVVAVVSDSTTSRTLLLVGQDVLEWEGDTDNPMSYSWRSRPMQATKPLNYGALQVRAAFDLVAESRPDAYPAVEGTIDDPLGPNTDGVNDGEPIDGPSAADVGNPAYSGVHVRLYADRQLRWQGMVRSEDVVRLPSGYKASEVELEISGSIPVFSVTVATTAKLLEQAP